MSLWMRHRFTRVLRPAAPLTVIAMGALILLRFPPAQYGFYPRCPIYESLRLQCPGCGATRALAALLHGHFSEAMHWNALTTFLFPIATVYGLIWYWRFVKREVIVWPQIPNAAVYFMLAAAALFTIFRNFPLAGL